MTIEAGDQTDNNLYISGESNFASPSGSLVFLDSSDNTAFRLMMDGTTLRVYTSNSDTQVANITAAGLVSIGKTTVDYTTAGVTLGKGAGNSAFVASGDGLNISRLGSDGPIAIWRRQGANVGSVNVSATATTYNTSSDKRLKDNVRAIHDSGTLIDLLRPVRFEWKSTGKTTTGFIAQEAKDVFPEAVCVPSDAEEMLSMDSGVFMAAVVAELQFLRRRVEKLEQPKE